MDRFDAAKAVRDLIAYFGHDLDSVCELRFGVNEADVTEYTHFPPAREGSAPDVARISNRTMFSYRFNASATRPPDEEVPT